MIDVDFEQGPLYIRCWCKYSIDVDIKAFNVILKKNQKKISILQ